MSDGTGNVADAPVGKTEAYGLNLKMILEETIKDLAELRDKYEQQCIQVLTQSNQLALKTLQDAQSAANVHLLNVIDSADKLSKSSIVHLATIAANEEEEQETEADTTIDDLAKLMQSVTVQLNGILTALNTVVANMATGRPPVNQSGTTDAAVAK